MKTVDCVEEYKLINGRMVTFYRSRVWVYIEGRQPEPVELPSYLALHDNVNSALTYARAHLKGA
jgi:hypothetical protein